MGQRAAVCLSGAVGPARSPTVCVCGLTCTISPLHLGQIHGGEQLRARRDEATEGRADMQAMAAAAGKGTAVQAGPDDRWKLKPLCAWMSMAMSDPLIHRLSVSLILLCTCWCVCLLFSPLFSPFDWSSNGRRLQPPAQPAQQPASQPASQPKLKALAVVATDGCCARTAEQMGRKGGGREVTQAASTTINQSPHRVRPAAASRSASVAPPPRL